MQKTSLLAGAIRKAPAKEMSVYSTLPKFKTKTVRKISNL